MGLEAADPDLARGERARAASSRPPGMVLDGTPRQDRGAARRRIPPAIPTATVSGNEMPTALVDYLEFYLLNYFKPGHLRADRRRRSRGCAMFEQIGCASCHVPDLTHRPRPPRRRRRDRVRPERGIFNGLFATATPLVDAVRTTAAAIPPLKKPKLQPFLVQNIFTDFKRHDLGPNFYERNWDGTPAEGVPDAAPLGRRHQGRLRPRRAQHQPHAR